MFQEEISVKLTVDTTKDPNGVKEEEVKSSDKSSQRATLEDFTIVNNLGRGAYGEVVLVKKKENGKKYAMKVMDKGFMRREQKEYQVFAEKEFLTKLDHPGVVKLFYTFQDKLKLYFVMEFLAGGGFSDFLRANNGKLDDKAAQFFAAEMVVILEYLHKNGIAHRDFKPENLMLTNQGHIKAIDFATAKYFNSELRPSEMFGKKKDVPTDEEVDQAQDKKFDRSSTFVGTALYVSPELLEDSQCSAPADLWALGCVVFQMTTGKMPFHANSEFMIFQQIKQVKIQWPSDINPVTKDIIERLLVRIPEARLGAGLEGSPNSYAALKSHPYFEGIDFDTIFEQESVMIKWLASIKRASVEDIPADAIAEQHRQAEQEGKASIEDFVSESTLSTLSTDSKKDYKVILTGQVDKKSPYLFYQLRQLVLTDEPRLKYYDPQKNKLKNEIPLNSNTKAELESKAKFHVNIPGRKYTFKSLDHPAEKWVKAINELCKG